MSMRFPLQSAGVLLVVLILVSLMISLAAAQSSTMFRGNPEHTGDYSSVSGGPVLPGPSGFIERKWYSTVSLYGASTPAVVDDVIYVGSGTSVPPKGYVYAIDAVTGEVIPPWPFLTENLVVSSPAVLDTGSEKILYVGDYDGWVYAINADTGAKIWEYQTGATIESSPVVALDLNTESEYTVYIGSDDDFVYALDYKTGAKKWEFQTRGDVVSSPAVAQVGPDTFVFVGSNDNNIYALNAKTGAKKWAFPTRGGVMSSPAVAQVGQDTYVFFGSNDGFVYALDADTRNTMWPQPFDTGSSVSASPAVAQVGSDTLVFIGSGGNLYAIYANTGIKKWSASTGYTAGTPSVADDVVWAGGCPYLYGFDAATGIQKELLSTTSCWGGSISSKLVVDGTVYQAGPEYTLFAFGTHKPVVDDIICDPPEGTANPFLSVDLTAVSSYHPDMYHPDNFKWYYQEESSPGFKGITTTQIPTLTHPFQPGIYDIKVTACNYGGCGEKIHENCIDAKPPKPVADFTGSPRFWTVPFTVTFTYVERGPADPKYLTSLEWSYKKHSDIGWTSIPPPVPGIPTTITKTFKVCEDGEYDIRVIAKNRGGEDEQIWENYIDARPPVPIVEKIEADETNGKTVLDVKFTATVSNNPTRLTWFYRKAGGSPADWIAFKQQQTLPSTQCPTPTQYFTSTRRFSWGEWDIMLQACNRNPTACGELIMKEVINVEQPVLETRPFCKIFPWSCDIIPCKKYCLLSGFCLYHCTFPYGGFPFLIFPSSK
jgi:outer membrane protein assembly factor BamB/PKD repeat protein